MGLKRSLGSNSVITQRPIKAAAVCMCGCLWMGWSALQLDLFPLRYIVKKTTCTWLLRGASKPCNPRLSYINQAQRTCNTWRGKEKKSPKNRRETDRRQGRSANKEPKNKWWWRRGSGFMLWVVQVVWGQSILYDIFFHFIDMHPGEVNAIMACAIDVCLVEDWLVWHLILRLTVKDGLMESWEHPWPVLPSVPHPCLSLLSPPLCSCHHLSIPFCWYISLTVSFPT